MGLETILQKIPNMIWPEQSWKYPMVQFMVGKLPFLRFGQKYQKYHSHIVTDFAEEIGVRIIAAADGTPLGFTPDEKKFKIEGAGFCNLDLIKKRAEFYGESEYYHKPINKEHLKSLIAFSSDIGLIYNPSR